MKLENTIFLRDIPTTVKETELLAFFLPCGNIISLKLSKREDNERNNGYGFVEFSSGDECKNAIQHCKQDTFNETRLSGELLSSLMLPNEDNSSNYLKNMPAKEVREILHNLSEIAKENPIQAQSLLQQNPSLTYALLEAEYQQGMLVTAAPGMDILLESMNH